MLREVFLYLRKSTCVLYIFISYIVRKKKYTPGNKISMFEFFFIFYKVLRLTQTLLPPRFSWTIF